MSIVGYRTPTTAAKEAIMNGPKLAFDANDNPYLAYIAHYDGLVVQVDCFVTTLSMLIAEIEIAIEARNESQAR